MKTVFLANIPKKDLDFHKETLACQNLVRLGYLPLTVTNTFGYLPIDIPKNLQDNIDKVTRKLVEMADFVIDCSTYPVASHWAMQCRLPVLESSVEEINSRGFNIGFLKGSPFVSTDPDPYPINASTSSKQKDFPPLSCDPQISDDCGKCDSDTGCLIPGMR